MMSSREQISECREDCSYCGVVPTNIDELFDQQIAGMARGEIIVIGGKPQSGKTLLIENIAATSARHINVIPTLLISAENKIEQVITRMSKTFSYLFDLYKKSNEICPDGTTYITKGPFLINKAYCVALCDIHAFTISALQELLSDSFDCFKGWPRLVCIDSLQMVNEEAQDENREQTIARLMSCLKSHARQTQATVIATSHFNRKYLERDPTDPAQLDDMRESGRIGIDADTVLAVRSGDQTKKHLARFLDNKVWYRGIQGREYIFSWEILKNKRRPIFDQSQNVLIYSEHNHHINGLS